jgi:hypothetical protein
MALRGEIRPNPKAGTALASSFVLLATPGTFYGCTVQIDPSATTGTYYVLVLDATSKPANSTDLSSAGITILHSLVVVHTSGLAEAFDMGAELEGYPCLVGCVVMLSSTAPTSITASAHLWLESSGVR